GGVSPGARPRTGKCFRERPPQGGIGGKTRDNRGDRLRHFVGRLDRPRDLLFEAARTPVPKHRRGPGEIPQGRGMAFERTTGHAASLHFAVGEAFAALVATCARQAAVDREALVVEERFPECALLLREWVVGRKRHGRRWAERGGVGGGRTVAWGAAGSSGGRAAGAVCGRGNGTSAAAVAPITPPARNAAVARRILTGAPIAVTSACRRQARCARRRRGRRRGP